MEVAQSASQSFFDHRMIEWLVQGVFHGKPRADRPGEKVRQVLRIRTENFRPQKTSGAFLAIDAQMALVFQHHPRAALIFEGDLADGEVDARFFERHKGSTGDGDLRIGKDDPKGRAAPALEDIGIAHRVLAGDPAFVSGLMQERNVVCRVPGEQA